MLEPLVGLAGEFEEEAGDAVEQQAGAGVHRPRPTDDLHQQGGVAPLQVTDDQLFDLAEVYQLTSGSASPTRGSALDVSVPGGRSLSFGAGLTLMSSPGNTSLFDRMGGRTGLLLEAA